jgi:hypothetical protein
MPLAPAIPVDRFLIADAALRAPEGFTAVDQAISAGLPHTISLEKDTKLVVIVPTGLITEWRNVDPTSIVSQSDDQMQPYTGNPGEPIADATRAPVQLLLMVGADMVGSLPLVAGVRRFVPDLEARAVQIELIVQSWRIVAGTLRGPGDFGSRIALSWRRATDTINQFSTPPPNPVLIPRMPPENRTQSSLGLVRFDALQIARFRAKRSYVR